MLTIKILGSGCANCKRLEEVARQAVADTGAEAEVVKVTDYTDILAYSIMATPGLVINDKVVSAGRIPPRTEIAKYIQAAQM